MHTLVILFSLGLGKTGREVVQSTIIVSMMLSFIINTSLIVYSFIALIILNVRKKKSHQIAQNKITIVPENDEFNRDQS